MQKPNSLGLVVVGENNCNILLVHKICPPEAYQLQGGADNPPAAARAAERAPAGPSRPAMPIA